MSQDSKNKLYIAFLVVVAIISIIIAVRNPKLTKAAGNVIVYLVSLVASWLIGTKIVSAGSSFSKLRLAAGIGVGLLILRGGLFLAESEFAFFIGLIANIVLTLALFIQMTGD